MFLKVLLASHSLIMMLGSPRLLCMSLIQNVLGSGTWLEGGAYRQTNNQATIVQTGVVDTSRYSDTPAGNNMRIRVPLSRKLNPGDAIWMIFWVQTPIGTLCLL